jgi:hypothetical protein
MNLSSKGCSNAISLGLHVFCEANSCNLLGDHVVPPGDIHIIVVKYNIGVGLRRSDAGNGLQHEKLKTRDLRWSI